MTSAFCSKCFFTDNEKCMLQEMNNNQLRYILSSKKQNIFLSACPGSGKTEVLGLKMFYELNNWDLKNSGIAVVTFTNSAEKELEDRINKYCGSKMRYPHFVGTFTSWIHSYIANLFIPNFIGYNGKDNDKSLRLIDSGIRANFLYNFSTKYSYSSLHHIYAQDYYCDIKSKKYKYYNNNNNSSIFEENLNNKDIDYMKEDLKDLKKRFWKAGFFLYEDVEYLVYNFLKRNSIVCSYIAKRFPLIIIDECQDLSFVELGILALLEQSGSKLHFIGDLNQSIYSFRNIEPNDIQKFINSKNFSIINLDINYRSCQQIVDISQLTINSSNKITAKERQKLSNPLIVFLIKNENYHKPIEIFSKIIEETGLNINHSRIIVRNNSLKNKILGCSKQKDTVNTFEEIAHALYLKKNQKNIEDLKESFNHMCLALQRIYFNASKHLGKDNNFKPEELDSFTWKKITAYYLEQLSSYQNITNFDLSWTEWTKYIKEAFPIIRKNIDYKLENEQFGKIRNGITKNKISLMFNIQPNSKVAIETIHSCKGMTLDAVLIISSFKKNNSDSATYWKQWFDIQNINENNRIAYVAFSRPKYLLGLVIPQNKDFTDDDYKFLASKFKIIEI